MPTGGLNIDCTWGAPPRVGERFTLPIGRSEVQCEVVCVAAYRRPQVSLDGVRSTHFVRFRRLPVAGEVRRFGVSVR